MGVHSAGSFLPGASDLPTTAIVMLWLTTALALIALIARTAGRSANDRARSRSHPVSRARADRW